MLARPAAEPASLLTFSLRDARHLAYPKHARAPVRPVGCARSPTHQPTSAQALRSSVRAPEAQSQCTTAGAVQPSTPRRTRPRRVYRSRTEPQELQKSAPHLLRAAGNT